jgi:hypothetical protein
VQPERTAGDHKANNNAITTRVVSELPLGDTIHEMSGVPIGR